MFRIESTPNPLDALVAGTGSNFVQNKLAQQAEQAELQKVDRATTGLNENSSDIDWLKAINRAPKNSQESLLKIHENISKGKKEGAVRQAAEEKRTAKEAAITAKEEKIQQEESERSKQLAKKYGLSEEDIEGLKPADVASLGRHRNKGGISSQPVPVEDSVKTKKVLAENPDADADTLQLAMDEAEVPRNISASYVENRRRKDEQGITRQDVAYKDQKEFIDDVTNQYTAFEKDTKPKLLQMQSIPSENLIGPTAAKFLETVGIPLGALENPSPELFSKLSLDLLKGLPETYGNRILKVEVDNFLRTIPQLINSPDGRRMIASNMLKLGEMKEVYYKEMRNQQKSYLDSNKALPKDFQQRVLDNVLPQMNKINNEFVQLSQLTSVPENHVPFFNSSGTISFVPKDPKAIKWATENGGKRIW
jgi:hypothetical protein